jgi:thiol:disulfide interchange protein DsbC
MKQVLAMRSDIVFYIKMFPLISIHPDAYAKSLAIVCQDSNEKSLKLLEDVYDNKKIKLIKCDSKAVDNGIRAASELGLTGTPAIIFQSGKKVSGSIKANDLVKGAIEK